MWMDPMIYRSGSEVSIRKRKAKHSGSDLTGKTMQSYTTAVADFAFPKIIVTLFLGR